MKKSGNLVSPSGISTILILISMIFLEACATHRADQVKVDRAINKFIDTTLDCPPSSVDSCSQDSPYRELTAKVFSSNSSKHFVNVLNHGEDALVARIHLIRSARKTILLQTFTWGNDETSRFLDQELLKAARRGVQVKILVDQYGTMGTGPKLELVAVAHSNLEVKVYNPLLNKAHINKLEEAQVALISITNANQRMHNKVMVVDNQIAIVGGRNIEDKYFDMDPIYTFKDREVLVVGRVVQDIRRSFLDYWFYEKSIALKDLTDVGHKIAGITTIEPVRKLLRLPVSPKLININQNASSFTYIQKTFSSRAIEVNGQVEFVADTPGKFEKDDDAPSISTLRARTILFQEARESIIIQTPYLCFSKEGLKQLKQLRKRFPDLQIIASSNSLATTDDLSVYSISLQQKKQLIKKVGVQIFEMKPIPGDVRQMIRRYGRLATEKENPDKNSINSISEQKPETTVGIHGKSFVLDNKIVWVGSHNFDPRSDHLNTEAALVIWDVRVADEVKEDILRDIEPQNSWVVAKREKLPILSFFTGLLETLSRKIPIIDVWPFYYSTSYELKVGGIPVPSDHPDFHEHYKSVGSFPGLNFAPEGILARPIKAFAGLAMPLI